MEPFALLKLMYVIGLRNGFNTHTILYIIVIVVGFAARFLVKQKKNFHILVTASIGLWVLCELVIDFDISSPYALAFFIGKISFCFSLGFLLGSFFCKVFHMHTLT